MAKDKGVTAGPSIKPRASISWYEKDGLKVDGDAPAMGKKCRMIVDGKVNGFRLDEFGGSIEIEAQSVRIEHLGMAEDGETLVDLMKANSSPRKKR